GGEPIARWETDVLGVEPLEDLRDAAPIVGIALEEGAVLLDEPDGRRGVHVVGRAADRGQAARDDGLAEALGREREIGHRRETPEALAQDAPAIHAELAADVLRVADDRVGAELCQVVGLIRRGPTRELGTDRGRASRSALVEEQDPVVIDGPLHPAGRRARRASGLDAGATLGEGEKGPGGAVRPGALTRDNGELRAGRRPGGGRDRVLALSQDRAGDAVGGAHRAGSSWGAE